MCKTSRSRRPAQMAASSLYLTPGYRENPVPGISQVPDRHQPGAIGFNAPSPALLSSG